MSANLEQIEITPEMISAGAAVLENLSGVVGEAFLAEQVYIAMARTLPEVPQMPFDDALRVLLNAPPQHKTTKKKKK